MRLEYQAETRWSPLQGQPLASFVNHTGALVGPGLPPVEWTALPFYDFTALIRLRDVAGGASEWYVTNGGRFWTLDKFGVAIAALNETASLRLSRQTVPAYLRFWAAFTTSPQRIIVLGIGDRQLADDAAGESDPLLRGIVVEGQGPQGWLLSATVLMEREVQRRYFRISHKGEVDVLERVSVSLADHIQHRKVG